jgi:uncharacterized iron-regulated membrane protein
MGLIAALFLTILGITGSVMAFEADIVHWMRPDLWRVKPGIHALPENQLIAAVENYYRPSRVFAIQISRDPALAQVLNLTDNITAYVNPYEGTILGSTHGPSTTDRVLANIHQIHLRLVPDPKFAPKLARAGKTLVNIAGLFLCLLSPSGVILWWRGKRTKVHFQLSDFKWSELRQKWPRILWESHQAIGIYAAAFLGVAGFTGILIGFDFGETMFYGITQSPPPERPRTWLSTPLTGFLPITADEAMGIARRALPRAGIATLVVPLTPTGSYTAIMREPEETSASVHSNVSVDQYTGEVLHVHDYSTDSRGYRWIRFNRSIHTGDIFGMPTHILVSLSSLALVWMAVTGIVIWWKKLA